MKCATCKRDINGGVEAQKAIQTWRVRATGEEKSFGLGAPDGNLVRNRQTNAYELSDEARAWVRSSGAKLVGVYHSKHWHHAAKREMRGGHKVNGRNLGAETITAYDIRRATMNRTEMEEAGLTEDDIASTTRGLQARADLIRKMAREAGTATGDWGIKERIRLMDNGGQPYYHTHSLRLEDFKIVKHLLYAHGVNVLGQSVLTEDAVVLSVYGDESTEISSLRDHHDRSHVQMSRDQLEKYKADDPGARPSAEADWRDQEVLEVADVPEPEPL